MQSTIKLYCKIFFYYQVQCFALKIEIQTLNIILNFKIWLYNRSSNKWMSLKVTLYMLASSTKNVSPLHIVEKNEVRCD